MFTVNLPKEKALPEEGIYNSKIVRAYDYKSQYGEPLVSVQFRVVDREGNFICSAWKNIVFPLPDEQNSEKKEFMEERATKFLNLIGMKAKGRTKIDSSKWIDKEIAVYLTKEIYQGEERPFIKYFCDPHKIDEELTKTEVQKIEDEVQLAGV